MGDSNRPSFHRPLFRRELDGGASSESRSPRVRSRSLRCVAVFCCVAENLQGIFGFLREAWIG